MGLDQRIDISVGQSLHLTAGLKQGLSVLGMTAVDLSDYVRDCVEENPMFDDDMPLEPRHPFDLEPYSKQMSVDEAKKKDSFTASLYQGDGQSIVDPESVFERYFVHSQTLEEYLLEQLRMECELDLDVSIGEYLIGCIDDNGYLQTSIASVAELCGVEKQDIVRVLRIVQQLGPAGIGARNLSERLILQLKSLGLLSPVAQKVILDHLEDLGSRNIKKIAKSTGLPAEDIYEVLNAVQSCDPRPCAGFGRLSDYVWPEVLVEADASGYSVRLQDFRLPRLKINDRYKALAYDAATPKETKAYLRERLFEAEGLIEGLSRRRAALFKVSCCVVEMQKQFFNEGFVALRPLSMLQVAELTDMAESSVSRLVNGNYMQTPRGVFEIRFFFQRGVSGSSEGEVSSESVKKLISLMVQEEDPRNPIGDQVIADALGNKGIHISRRTINKYRTELNIPSQTQRRRQARSK